MLRLNDYLPYLINRIGPPLEDGFAAPLAGAGVSLQMWRVLAVLHQYGDQAVGALSELTSINFSTLSRLIDRMVEAGLVSRQRSGRDARSVTVQLSAGGQRVTRELIPKALAYEQAIVADFSAAEIESFKRLLIKADQAVRRLNQAAAVDDARRGAAR